MISRCSIICCVTSLIGSFLTASVLAQTPPEPVAISPVVEKYVNTGQPFIGTIIPTHRATVGSAVDGRVIEYPIETGDRVEAGQTLAQILTDTISLEIDVAQAQLALRKQELRELENGARPEEIAQALAQLKSAQATHTYNKTRLDRTMSLFNTGGVTQQTVDEVQSLAAASEQKLLEAQANYQLVKAGPREEQIAQARAQVAMQDAVIRQLQDKLKKHTITTRFSGFVVTESTEAGAWVAQGDPIAEIVALDQVDVQTYVSGQAVAFVKLGAQVRVEVPALPERIFTGTVVAINPQGNVQTRTFPVLVRIKNEIVSGVPTLKAGMIARVVLPTGPRQKSILIPKDAIVLGLAQPIIFVVDDPNEDGTATVHDVPVRLGIADGLLIEAIGDVRRDQSVVVLGNEGLKDGQTVRITKTLTFEKKTEKERPRETVGSLPPETR